jgi:hypothetical protein
MVGSSVGDVLAQAAQNELAREFDIKSSLAQRASIVVTSSGGFITLSLGSSVLAARPPVYRVPTFAFSIVSVALILLLAAALTALYINSPWRERALNLEILDKDPNIDYWKRTNDSLAIEIYEAQRSALIFLRKQNMLRSKILFLALAFECAAITALSIGVGVILTTSNC